MNKENVIEWLTGQDVITVTLTQKKFINKVLKLSESHPDDVRVHINPDGSIMAKLPLKYLKLSAPRVMTEEQKEQARERLLSVRG